MKKFLLWLSLFSSPFFSKAQDFDLGLVAGLAMYNGDLSPQEFGIYMENVGIGAGIFARSRFSRFLSVRTGITYAQIKGDEKSGGFNPERGLNFTTDIVELSLMGEWNLFYLGYSSAKTTLSPYLTFGVGAFYFDPKIALNGQDIRLRPLGTEGQGAPGYPQRYLPVQFSVPIGGGVNFVIQDQWTLGIELIAHRSQTDYLDDVSDQQVVYGDVYNNNGPLAARISNPLIDPQSEDFDRSYSRGGRFTDWFYVTGITLSYRLANRGTSRSRYMKRNACPRF